MFFVHGIVACIMHACFIMVEY